MKLLSCNTGSGQKSLFSGLIFLRRTGYVKPVQSMTEFLAEEDTEAVRAEERGFENFHGFNIAFDQAVDGVRLGIREDLQHNMERWAGGRPAGAQILDERINHRLRSLATREVGLEKQRLGKLRSRWRAGAGFFANVRNLLRTRGGEVEARIEEMYGPERTVEQRRIRLARTVWNALTPAQRMAVQADLITRGVPLPPPPPVPAGVNPQILQLSLAEPEQLEDMRAALPFFQPRRLDPIFPTREQIPPPTALARLIQFREVEATEREKLQSTTVYDATRLQHFLDDIRRTHPPIMELINQILVANALYPLENHPEGQVLVAYFEERLRRRGPADLRTELERTRDNLPTVTEKREEGKEPSDELLQLERVQELTKNVAEMHGALGEKYNEADSKGSELYNLQRDLDALGAPPAAGAAGRAVDIGHRETRAQINALQKEKSKLQLEINNGERKFQQQSNELMQMLVARTRGAIPAAPAGGATDPHANLRIFNAAFGPGVAPPGLSNENQLFGNNYAPAAGGVAPPPNRPPRGPSAFETAINALTPAQMRDMGREIKRQYHNLFKKRERVTPRQLIYLLKEGDFTRQGVTNPELRRRRALFWTNKRVAIAGNLQLFRSSHLELAEHLGEATLGSRRLNRLRKSLRARFSKGKVLTGRDAIDKVAGFEKGFHIFKGMPLDSTLSELRDFFERKGGMSDAKLFEFAEKLKEVFLSFEMLNSEGKVELFDGDALDMERLISNLSVIREEIRTRKFFEEIRGESGDKAEAILKKIRADEEGRRKDEQSLLSRIKDKFAEWKQYFSKKFLKQKFTESCAAVRKLKKTEKLSGPEFESKLAEQGLTTAYDVLKTGLAAKEAYDTARTVKSWTGGKLRTGGARLGRSGKWIWEKGLRPTGKYVVVKPAVVAGKVVAFPFRLAKKVGLGIWDWAKPKSGGGAVKAIAHH